MSNPEQHRTTGTAWRGCGLLVLLALAWTQLALATHQFDHPATSADDTCSLCLQLDRTGNSVAPDAPAAAVPDAAAVRPAGAALEPAARRELTARQRGPPLS